MQYGATPLPEGGVQFRVWAPKPALVRLDVDGAVHEMTRSDDGWWVPVGDLPDPTPPATTRREGRGVIHQDPYKRISPPEYFEKLAGVVVPRDNAEEVLIHSIALPIGPNYKKIIEAAFSKMTVKN